MVYQPLDPNDPWEKRKMESDLDFTLGFHEGVKDRTKFYDAMRYRTPGTMPRLGGEKPNKLLVPPRTLDFKEGYKQGYNHT
jgi:hypothetical protein